VNTKEEQVTTVQETQQTETNTGMSADEFAGRLFGAVSAAAEMYTVDLGLRLGYYRALLEAGAVTAPELASRTGTHARYAREWLEQQAASGIVTVAEAGDGSTRQYALPSGHAEVLLDEESLTYFAPMAGFAGASAKQLDALTEAFRTGGGVPWSAYGQFGVEAQAALNRPAYSQLLGSVWLPSIEDVHARLQADPPARVADLAAGGAWSSIAIARAYPRVLVEAFDVDEPSVALAKRNIAQAGLEGRVSAHARDVSDATMVGQYDLVTIFEALHDMSRPVEALRAARGMLAEGGSVIVMDERVGEEFVPDADPIERFMYSFSVLLCLPAGMSEQPSAGTGTVMRPSVLEAYAREAGFSNVEVLPIEYPFWRFYRLRS
jgi:2-polyprenyl-3-methyl-5-hydroxy-6-metoxy-1,4-benzoquinol methylase